MPSANNPSRQKWCQLCQWNYSHATPKCMRILRMPREREYGGQGQQMPARQEQPKPLFGSQPPPLEATLVKYMKPNYPIEIGLEMVRSKPYYQEEEHQR